MQELPSIWRTALWHPLSVHFPMVLLLLGTLVGAVDFFSHKPIDKVFLRRAKAWLLGAGILTGWLAIYTGTWAYNVEVRKLCDPGVLQNHQWWGYAVILAYSAAGLIEIFFHFVRLSTLYRLKRFVVFLLFLVGGCGMLYVGHLGASLVYQQSAGTYRPSEDCHEFE